MTNPSGGGRFSSAKFESNHDKGPGRGRGLASVEIALVAATKATQANGARGGGAGGAGAVPGVPGMPGGELDGEAFESQGRTDLELATRHARHLAAIIRYHGREVGEAAIADAIGAGACALTVWRNTGRGVDGEPATQAKRVCWRAVVRSLSDDKLGDAMALHSLSEDCLFAAALPCETARERVIRWGIERRAPGRAVALGERVEALKAFFTPRRGGETRGRKRFAVIDRIGQAAAFMLAGLDVDTAAARAGFKSYDHCTAGNSLSRACRRLGVVGDARVIGRGVARPDHVAAARLSPVPGFIRASIRRRLLPAGDKPRERRFLGAQFAS